MKVIKMILTTVFLSVFLYSAYQSWSIHSEYQTGRNIYQATAEDYLEHSPKKEMDDRSVQSVQNEQAPVAVDFDGLKELNPDILGWLYCENTSINYPILQGDSNEAYLHTLPDGTTHKNGSIFVDYRCEKPFEEGITLIYGHHMKDGSMFGSLKGYQEQKYYEAHSVMWLLTPEENYEVQMVSAYITDTNDEIYYFDGTTSDWQAMLTGALERSDFTRKDINVTEGKILVLSTCSYESDNARYVVWGVLK